MHLRVANQIEQKISVERAREARAGEQQQYRMDAQLAGSGSELPAPIRLHTGPGDDGFGALGQNVGHEEIEFAGFIPAKSQAGLIVALDEQIHAADARRVFQAIQAESASAIGGSAERPLKPFAATLLKEIHRSFA